ncbi:MAG: hypothetical protein WD118_01285 [Phycisphaeraceae bacterium]
MQKKVIQQVLEQLGRAPWLEKVDARELWPCHWRVNLWRKHAKGLLGDHHIALSYFVTTDGDGVIVSSQPPIERAYDPLPAEQDETPEPTASAT